MKTKKIGLADIQGKLNRSDMKQIMAGCGGGSGEYCHFCTVWSDCHGGICGQWAGRCYGAKFCW